MNDKGTIVQQLEDEHDHLLEKIQKMQALLERWMGEERKQPLWNPDRHKKLVNDTETLLKEAKEVRG